MEDDIGDGEQGGLSRTDTVGNVVQWTPRDKTPGPGGERKFYRLNPPPQEYPSTMVEDAQDADAEAASDVTPKRIVSPLSKSASSRGADFMAEDESEASAGSVETDWPGTKSEYPFVGAPKGYPKTPRAAAASEEGADDSPEDAEGGDVDEAGDGDAPAAEGAAAADGTDEDEAAAAAGSGAPALLKNLQTVILKADESKTEYTELQRKLNALNRMAARLGQTTVAAKSRYAHLVAQESSILNNLQTVDAETAAEGASDAPAAPAPAGAR